MSSTIRWGIISTAGINSALLDPIRQAERSELAAVASRDLDRAKEYAQKEEIPVAYGSYEELLADPDIDAVYNPLPNALHAEWTVKAAEAGKHVLCEKPFVTNMADFDRVEAAVQANNVTVFEAFMYLHHPQTLRAQEIIRAGKLGTVQQIVSWFHFYLPPERSENIRLRPDVEGGSLWDVGVYPTSMAVTMAGAATGTVAAPSKVSAHQHTGETGVDVGMRAQLVFDNDDAGIVAQLSSSFRTPFREGTQIIGDEGILTISEPWKPGLTGSDSVMQLTSRSGVDENITTASINPYLCEVQAMEACVLDGAEPVVSLAHSRTILETVLAIYEAAA